MTPSTCLNTENQGLHDYFMRIWGLKAAPINIFISSYQISMCDVKGVAWSEETTHDSAASLGSTEHFSIFQLNVLVLWPAALRSHHSLSIVEHLAATEPDISRRRPKRS